uniref:Putative secreted protein n=1 Tax=Anopheles marajoara TaxID=58244 RepID=A0A2M4C8I4_9DIPT
MLSRTLHRVLPGGSLAAAVAAGAPGAAIETALLLHSESGTGGPFLETDHGRTHYSGANHCKTAYWNGRCTAPGLSSCWSDLPHHDSISRHLMLQLTPTTTLP